MADTAPGPPPEGMDIESSVDGWVWTLPPILSRSDGRFLGWLLAGASVIVVVGAIAGRPYFDHPEVVYAMFGGALLGPLLTLGLFRLSSRPSRRVHLERAGLRLSGFGRRRDRVIPWESLDAPRVVDPRSDWDRAFLTAGVLVDITDDQNRSLGLRWPADGRPASTAHDHTDWDRTTVGRNLSAEGAEWLIRAIAYMARKSEARRREAEFDEMARGRVGDRAKDALDKLRGSE